MSLHRTIFAWKQTTNSFLSGLELGKPQKKTIFFYLTCPLRGGGLRACPLRKKEFFFNFCFLVAVEKLNIFCLRRHVEILILGFEI